MTHLRHLPRIALSAMLASLIALSSATAHPDRGRGESRADADIAPGQHHDDKQHDGDEGHLRATRENIDLVGKLELTGPFGNVVPGQIADVSYHRGFGYLNSWAEETCTRGGVFIADMRTPSRPEQAGFVPALRGNYHGEGAHVIRARTSAFRGDLLAVNNELCDGTVTRGGGFDLYDVSRPKHPKVLVQGFGDVGGEGSLTGTDTLAKEYHSVFLWQDDDKVYLVGVDNEELHDVDIFDVSDPAKPVGVAEHDLVEEFPEILEGDEANGNELFHHDMVVKEIGGTQTLLSSYWDAGYVKLDVDDPTRLRYLGDTSFAGPDPLTGAATSEGNGHQAEFSGDDRFVLAADEDFNPYRAGEFRIATGSNAGAFPSAEVGGGTSAASLPDRRLNGPVVFGGYACDRSPAVPRRADVELGALAPGEEAILVVQRGPTQDPSAPGPACMPGEKAANAAAAGWYAVIVANRHAGAAADDEAFCGSGGYPPGARIVTLCTSHAALHRLFGTEPRFELPVGAGDVPARGAVGERVESASVFDGWGYARLFRNEAGKLTEIDQYAVPEALNPSFAFGFGDLSIHEVATDPRRNLAYVSYYAAGARVVQFGDEGVREVGRFIDEGGNDFWGVEYAKDERGTGRPLFVASDRDFGLYVLRYRGPGSR